MGRFSVMSKALILIIFSVSFYLSQDLFNLQIKVRGHMMRQQAKKYVSNNCEMFTHQLTR